MEREVLRWNPAQQAAVSTPGMQLTSSNTGARLMRILVVDDHAPFAAVIVHFLSRQPDMVVVGQAYDHLNGFRLVDELKPDLVLVDYSMPMMDGITFTRMLKSKSTSFKVVLMSFIADGHVQRDAQVAGADAFIDKDGILDRLVPLLQLTLRPKNPGGAAPPQPSGV